MFSSNGWLNKWIAAQDWLPFGLSAFQMPSWKIAYTPTGIVIALIFIGLPFVVRTVQPVLEEFEAELEEAAATLGANRWQTITRVILPRLTPAILTGFALAFARAVGEYGSVIFIAGNLPNISEIAPVLIVIKLEEFDQAGAAVIAVVLTAGGPLHRLAERDFYTPATAAQAVAALEALVASRFDED